MLRALGDPVSLLVLALSFVLACTLSGWVQVLVLGRGTRLDDPRRRRPDPRAHLDPFGVVAAALTGVGWPRPVALPRTPNAVPAALAGPALLLLLGAACLVGVGALEGQVDVPDASLLLQSGVAGGPLLSRVLLLTGVVHLCVGLLSLVPLPPLDGGRLLLARAPRTQGWQRAEEYLVGRNYGTVAVLVLLLLPLAGRLPLLLALLAAVVAPLVRLLTGLG